MGERVRSWTYRADELGADSRHELFLDRLRFAAGNLCQQRALEDMPNDRRGAEQVDGVGWQPDEALAHQCQNTRWYLSLSGIRRNAPATLIGGYRFSLRQHAGLDPTAHEFLDEEGIALALARQQPARRGIERAAQVALGKPRDVGGREWRERKNAQDAQAMKGREGTLECEFMGGLAIAKRAEDEQVAVAMMRRD